MKSVVNLVWQLGIWRDVRGQDLIEYALMAVLWPSGRGAVMPNVATRFSPIFSNVGSVMTAASTAGS